MESTHKLTAGSLCLVSLTAIAGIINPAHPVIGSIITGTSGAIASVVANAFDKLTEPEKLSLQNDLPKVIGKAIGKIIEEVASEKKWSEYKSELQEIAKNSPENFLEIIKQDEKNPALKNQIKSIPEYLRKNFKQEESEESQSNLNASKSESKNIEDIVKLQVSDWKDIVEKLYQQTFANRQPESFRVYQPPKELTPDLDLINHIAEELQKRFPHALTEVLTHDFANDGKAYAALTLNLLTDIQGKFAENQDEHKEILENINNLAELLKSNDPEKIKKLFQEISDKISYLFPVKKTVESIELIVIESQEKIAKTQENSEIINKNLVNMGQKIDQIDQKIDQKFDSLMKIKDDPYHSISDTDTESSNVNQKTITSENQSFDINFKTNETLCFQEIDDGRQMIIRIKAPENMGKNTLVKKIEKYAREKQYLTVRLDFWLPTEETLKDYTTFLQWCCDEVSEQLNLETIEASQYWNTAKGDDNAKINSFFNRQIMPKINTTILVVFLSSLDQVFPLSFAKTFLKLLRSWQNTKTWKNLRLVLSHSTECYIELYQDENDISSPFNVGLRIELEEFDYTQINDLAKKHQIDLDDKQIKQIMSEVGGHPYLIDQIFSHLKSKMKTQNYDFYQVFAEIVSFAFLETIFDGQYLSDLYSKVEKQSDLLDAVKELLKQEPAKIENKKVLFMLESLGLVIKDNTDRKTISFRNNLYRQYFSQKIGQ